MFDSYVAPRLAPLAAGRRLARRVIKVTGRSESQVEEIAFPIYSRLGDERAKVDTTILAAPGQIELHLSASGTEEQVLNERLDEAVAELADALGTGGLQRGRPLARGSRRRSAPGCGRGGLPWRSRARAAGCSAG